MAKKFKKSAKEINRLANLYHQPVQTNSGEISVNQQSSNTPLVAEQMKEQAMIRRDLGALAIVIAIVLVAMFALNYLIDNTALGGMLTTTISRIL